MYFSRVRLRPEILRSSQLGKVLGDNAYNMHRLFWDLFTNNKKRNFIYREEIARKQLGSLSNARCEPVYYVVSHTKPVSPEGSLFAIDCKDYEPKLNTGQNLAFELRANPVITRQGKKHDVVMDAQRTFLIQLCTEMDLFNSLPPKPEKRDYKILLISEGGDALSQYLTAYLENDWCYAERLEQANSLKDMLEWSLKACIDNTLEKWLIKQGENHGFELKYKQIESSSDNDIRDYQIQNTGYRWQALPGKGKKGDKAGFSTVDFTGALQITDVKKFSKSLFEGIGRSKAFGCGLLLVRRA